MAHNPTSDDGFFLTGRVSGCRYARIPIPQRISKEPSVRNINMYLFKNVCAIALVAMLSACGAESAGTESEAGESSADEQSQTTETGEQGGSD
ncbi:uncharacterized protein METZ01_LOCUS454520, partial [marine metagenome]